MRLQVSQMNKIKLEIDLEQILDNSGPHPHFVCCMDETLSLCGKRGQGKQAPKDSAITCVECIERDEMIPINACILYETCAADRSKE